jgi:hypothetical protein
MKCIQKFVAKSIAIGIVIEYDVKTCVLFFLSIQALKPYQR